MYLRSTKRVNKDGSVVEYYQLAHNERHPKTRKPVARIIHNFGRADRLDRQELVRLCKSIARVCGLIVTDPYEELPTDSAQSSSSAFPDDLKIGKTRELGCPLAIEALWERLGIKKTLNDICEAKGLRVPYERALLAMTANRLCEPESKLGVWDRWLSKVHMPSCDGLKLKNMYDAMDILHENAAEVEETVFYETANLFNLDVDLIFYDTTTASFHIDREDEPDHEAGSSLRKYGHSKEGFWAPQVVVALAVTREGIPVRSWVFPGNTSDVSTVEKVRADLRGWKLGRALFVADSGMNSADNRAELSRACGKYLLACRMAGVSEIKREVLTKRGRFTSFTDNLRAKEVIVGDGERRKRYILCHNPKEAERQRKRRNLIVAMLEAELGSHKDTSATAQWAINLLASRRFKRYLRVTKGGKVRLDRSAIREAGKYDGKWVLETNDDSISLEDAARGYKGLMVIERCFRSLKRTQIKMTPMYHWASRRIEAHVKICVFALMIERIAERACGRPWHEIRRALGELQVTEFFNLKNRVLMRNELPQKTRNILKLLKIKTPKQVLEMEKIPKNGPKP
ncbi:transposase [Candidatus Desulfarcum epimagneticum]|uniref:Transposase n=1 Tax=uncultured Desulfobacteraceae bacterium TaxID=218296 RepID=A0A484HM60_9BACT|nr:transposase [uncultured Desulfobacteraceae bacterium]VEN75310.1 transposase [uncultured Desulfobacteraceae bacterium]